MKLAAVVPTRNEEGTIAGLVADLYTICDLVIVADDSDDNTAIVALGERAEIVDPPPGLGPAYLEAWKKIPDDHHVIHVDAGGSHPLSSIRKVARYAKPADLVIGSRFCDGGTHQGSSSRRVGSKTMARMMNLATLAGFDDWTSGLRRYSPRARELLSYVEYTTEGHAWQMESLYAAYLRGLKIEQVGIDYLPSSSSLDRGRVLEALKFWWAVLWAR